MLHFRLRETGVGDMVADHLSTASFAVGDFVAEPRRNILHHYANDLRHASGAGEVHLEPKVMDVLCALAEMPGEVVSRADLIDRVWGVRHGGDESLTRAICILRRKFSDHAAEAYIETVPKRGYRLLAPVRPVDKLPPSASAPPRAHRSRVVRRGPMIAASLALAFVLAALFLARFAGPPLFSEAADRRSGTALSAT